MRRKVFIVCCLVILMITLFYSHVLALKEETHKAINMNIAEKDINNFSLDMYLIRNIGFIDGYKQKLVGLNASGGSVKQSIAEWLGYGGEQEDRPGAWYDYLPWGSSRSLNHFHNPLKTNWDDAGLNDFGKTGQSSILWAQNIDQDPNHNLGGEWSWQDVREYFYVALTGRDVSGNNVTPLPGETEKEKRERYYTNTFRGIGQLMHLVEDASVPEHVRNDAHILKAYEGYVLDFQTKLEYRTLWNDFLANPISFDKSILNITSTYPSATVPISRIIDTDLYNGDNPNATTTVFGSPQYIGIAEYTNANFISNDTFFTHLDFNYPNINDTVLWTDNDDREYIRKVGSGDTINHLARTSLLYSYRKIYFPQYTDKLPVGLDEECYKEYASNLIPRAVGYSAGLLNYFFRGKINIIQISVDKFHIVNLSDEDMEGDLTSFRLFYDDISDNRNEISLIYLDGAGAQYTGPISLPAQSKSAFTVKLDLQSTPVVNPKTPGDYMLVFKGKLGNEGVAPYDTSYAVAAQLITPHFLTHAEINGQWDIYEYDLLGNRIYNVTGGLPRGIPYHHAIPNPANTDLIVFQTDMSCPENSPQPWTVCQRILTKSTGDIEVAEWVRIPWWSKDGQRVYGVDGGYYDLTTGSFEPNSPWNAIDGPSFCGYGYFVSPSLSHDESMLAIEANNPLYNPSRVDTIIFTPNGQSVNASGIIDMNTMTLAVTDNQSICSNYIDDEIFFDTSPDFHPVDNRIVFSSNESGPYEIYETDLSTRVIQQLTTASAGDAGYYQPAWSPDGQDILFVGEMQGELPEIYSMPSTDGIPMQITNDGVKHYYPRWMRYLGQ